MKIAIRKERDGSVYLAKNFRDDISYTEPPYNFKIIELDEEDCEVSDFDDDLLFNLDKYRVRKQKEKNNVRVEELDNWFKNNYTTYEQMLVRRKTLGIEDMIVDDFRNKTYHNLIELYEEAEDVASEIRELRKNVK